MFKLFFRNFQLAYQANRFYVIALTAANILFAAIDLSSILILARLIDLFVAYLTSPTSGLEQEAWVWFGLLVVRWICLNIGSHFLEYIDAVHKPKIAN